MTIRSATGLWPGHSTPSSKKDKKSSDSSHLWRPSKVRQQPSRGIGPSQHDPGIQRSLPHPTSKRHRAFGDVHPNALPPLNKFATIDGGSPSRTSIQSWHRKLTRRFSSMKHTRRPYKTVSAPSLQRPVTRTQRRRELERLATGESGSEAWSQYPSPGSEVNSVCLTTEDSCRNGSLGTGLAVQILTVDDFVDGPVQVDENPGWDGKTSPHTPESSPKEEEFWTWNRKLEKWIHEEADGTIIECPDELD